MLSNKHIKHIPEHLLTNLHPLLQNLLSKYLSDKALAGKLLHFYKTRES